MQLRKLHLRLLPITMNFDNVTITKAEIKRMYPKINEKTLMNMVNDVLTRFGQRPYRKYQKEISPKEFQMLQNEYLNKPTHDQLGREIAY